MVRPTTSWRGSLNAMRMASASSTPGSVSISSGIRSVMRPLSPRALGSGGGIARSTADPARDDAFGHVRRAFEQVSSELVDLRKQVGIACEVRNAEAGQSGLARTQQLTRAAQFQVLLGDQKAVVRLPHRFQALLGQLRKWRLVQQHAT